MNLQAHSAGVAREVLARNMRELRAVRGWSQEYLAFETGLHRTFIAHCERGARNISLDNIEKIANAFQVSVADLFQKQLKVNDVFPDKPDNPSTQISIG